MNTNAQTSSQYFFSLRVIFFALLVSQLLFAAIVVLLKFLNVDIAIAFMRQSLIVIVPVFVVGGIFMSYFLFNKKLADIKPKRDLLVKTTDYRAALIVRYALLEGPSFFAIISFMLTGEWLFLSFAAIIIGVFIIIMPTVDKFVKDLELNPNEEQKVRNPQSIIAYLPDNEK